MPIDLSAIHPSTFVWLLVIGVVIIVVFGIFRFFFRHLIHLFFRGCGLILIVVVASYLLHLLKLL